MNRSIRYRHQLKQLVHRETLRVCTYILRQMDLLIYQASRINEISLFGRYERYGFIPYEGV
ncbi:hypothetical protein SAMN05216325_1087 [Nitrosomonas marina]|uniref:Uncharacterized protein n=1 Tax=Nitrosomonas marina TaxID=917 RepID=A0A1H8DVS7_9PROT|nr:hypothetical protein SAMN05216325_1087 [Nitrosomonas marina]